MTSCLYQGHVAHRRQVAPFTSFRHPMYMWLVDLAELAELGSRLRLLGVDRPGVHGIHRCDHLGDPGLPIRENVVAYAAGLGVDLRESRICMLANARVLGHVFNPLSLFYCHGTDGALTHVVAEVCNTHGERHCYLVTPDDDGRCRTDKAFYVSPFLAPHGAYRMHVPAPDGHLAARIELEQHGEAAFVAELSGRRLPLSDRTLAYTLARHPLMTWQVSTLIRRHGIGLWARGMRVYPHTPAKERPVS